MISSLRGQVAKLGATWVVIDVNGVGLRATCTPAAAAALRPGQTAELATSLVVREDSLTLFGFAGDDERDCFELVQTATGVGPKLAMAIVSVLSPAELQAAIAAENLPVLTRVPGVGVKGAQRLVIELKDKIRALAVLGRGAQDVPVPGAEPLWRQQVRSGLEGLGWSARDAEAACDRVAELADATPEPPVSTLMRAALRSLAKG